MGRSWSAGHGGPVMVGRSFVPEVDEDASEVVRVLLDPVVQRLDLLLVEEAQHPLLQLATALSGDDLDQPDLLLHRFVDDGTQRAIEREVVAPLSGWLLAGEFGSRRDVTVDWIDGEISFT